MEVYFWQEAAAVLGAPVAFWQAFVVPVAVGTAWAAREWRGRRRAHGQAPAGLAAVKVPRTAFQRALGPRITAHEEQPYSLILFAIDGFHALNDRYGAETGTAILWCVEQRLRATLPRDAALVRFGAGEFLASLPGVGADDAYREAQRVLPEIATRGVNAAGPAVPIRLAAGVASYPDRGNTLREILNHVTTALRQAQEQGRDIVVAAHADPAGHYRLAAVVEKALGENRVVAAYQPIIDLRTGRPVAEEVLARIVVPRAPALTATPFMDAATDGRLASRIDEHLMNQTLERCRQQIRYGDRRLRFIPVSAALLQEPGLIADIARRFVGCEAVPSLVGTDNPLVIEISERELLSAGAAARAALQPLLGLGARLAIHDFGCGYGSILHLTSLPVSFVKIRIDLLQTAHMNSRARPVVAAIQGIAKELNIRTIVVDIEDETQAVMARDHGMDWGQGYYFGRPALEVSRPAAPL